MFERLRTKRANREIIDRVYEAVVARARQPALYLQGGLPDTVLGRYEALGIEVLLLLSRCRGERELEAFAQDIVDRFMLDMDHSLREIGIGYQSVPKRMRKLANRFYTRVAGYERALAARDTVGLAAALELQAYGDEEPPNGGPAYLAEHMVRTADEYAGVPTAVLLTGRIDRFSETQRV